MRSCRWAGAGLDVLERSQGGDQHRGDHLIVRSPDGPGLPLGEFPDGDVPAAGRAAAALPGDLPGGLAGTSRSACRSPRPGRGRTRACPTNGIWCWPARSRRLAERRRPGTRCGSCTARTTGHGVYMSGRTRPARRRRPATRRTRPSPRAKPRPAPAPTVIPDIGK